MRLPLLNTCSITPEYILKNIENEHQNIICGNRIDYFRTIYTFSHRLCEKKKFSSDLLSKNSCLLICIFCSHHTNKKYYDSLPREKS